MSDGRRRERTDSLARVIQRVIDPDSCIDCSLCKPECPIDAIVETEEEDEEWAEINRRLSLDEGWTEHEPVEARPRNDPPRRPDVNTIVNP